MSDAEADELHTELTAAGLRWEAFFYYLPSGRLMDPDAVDFETMPESSWGCDSVPLWPILPDTHPCAARMDAARDRWFGDASFAAIFRRAWLRFLDWLAEQRPD